MLYVCFAQGVIQLATRDYGLHDLITDGVLGGALL